MLPKVIEIIMLILVVIQTVIGLLNYLDQHNKNDK